MPGFVKEINLQHQRKWKRQRGAALLLALLVAMMFSLAFFFKSANIAGSNYAREQGTEEALAQAKAALIGYAATYRDSHPNEVFGYLLCPDTNNDGVTELVCGVAGETMIGRLPYKTLGLPDLRATGGECLWYVVSGSHKYNPKTAPLNWDTRGQIRVQDNIGNALIDPNDASGGAVAVILAPGSPLNGQSRPTGTFNCSGDATNSIASYLDGGYAIKKGTLTVVAGQPESSINNDRLIWISARELFSPIAKRNDLFITGSAITLFDGLKACFDIQTTLTLPTNPSPRVNGNTKAAILTPLNFPQSLPGCSPIFSTGFANTWANWKNQFGYVVCNDQATGCITVNGISCRGALIFSGRQVNGNPRATTDNFEVLAGNNFLEEPNLTSYLSASYVYSGIPPYIGTNPSKDIVLCLKP